MNSIRYKDWQLIPDSKSTAAVYSKVAAGSADCCTCAPCKNYAAQRSRVFPPEVAWVLAALGIDQNRESELCHYGTNKEGLHHYNGWFHFKGRFEGPDCTTPLPLKGTNFELKEIEKHFCLGFHNGHALNFFNTQQGLVQVEFEVFLPWTIEAEAAL